RGSTVSSRGQGRGSGKSSGEPDQRRPLEPAQRLPSAIQRDEIAFAVLIGADVLDQLESSLRHVGAQSRWIAAPGVGLAPATDRGERLPSALKRRRPV